MRNMFNSINDHTISNSVIMVMCSQWEGGWLRPVGHFLLLRGRGNIREGGIERTFITPFVRILIFVADC